MFNSVQIDGFRGLRRLSLAPLERLNLLVGTNNSGKTSVLEALYILTRAGDPNALYQMMTRRGEKLPDEPEARAADVEYDVCHLFSGHEIRLGSRFSVRAEELYSYRTISFTLNETEEEDSGLFRNREVGLNRLRLVLSIEGDPSPQFGEIPLSARGGLTSATLQSIRRLPRAQSSETLPCVYISTDSLSAEGLVRLWDRLTLTPYEDFVLNALRSLDPDIERVAALASNRLYSSSSLRGSFVVKMRGNDQPIPIGSMGDGMWRMLALAIAVTQARGGLLLVDEIDTGLHHSVMDGMWKMLSFAAREFEVQVFATTHSVDCVNSLARTRMSDYVDRDNDDFTLQRLETGREMAVPYTPKEIRIAAERHIEVR